MPSSEYNRVERAAILTQELLNGAEMRTVDAARLCGVSSRTARRDLNSMSRVIAIYRDDGGLWRLLQPDD